MMPEYFHEREFQGIACQRMIDLFVGHLGKRVATASEILEAGHDLSVNPVRFLRAVRAMRVAESTLPSLQLERAYQLALSNGHLWATALRDYWEADPRRAVRPISVGQINRLAEADEGAIPGLYLLLSEDGSIQHETITKRARWRVAPDGCVTLWIARPSCDVLRAEVTVEGVAHVENVGLDTANESAEDRHWWALDAYLRVLKCSPFPPDAHAAGGSCLQSGVGFVPMRAGKQPKRGKGHERVHRAW